MRKWKARLGEARVDKKIHGTKHERDVSTEIDAALRFWDSPVRRRRKFLPLDVIVLGYEPSTTLLIRRLKEATEEEPELKETKQGVSRSQNGHDSQNLPSELGKWTLQDGENCVRSPMVESYMLADCASELLAIRSSSGEPPSNHDADVDLIAASYLLRLVSQSIDGGSGLTCAGATDFGTPSLSQQQARRPLIKSTLITAPQNLVYGLHNLSTNHDPEAKYIAPYISTARHAFITIDLACIADTDTLTNQSKILTILKLSNSIVQGWSGCRPSHIDIFLIFTNLEQLSHQLSSAEQELGHDWLRDLESNVHEASPSLPENASPTAIYRYLNSLFADVEPAEVAALLRPRPANSDTTPTDNVDPSRPSAACRATINYIFSRFHRVPGSDVVSFYPCFIDTKDNASLRTFWRLVNDVVISESLRICYCFGTTPSVEDRGPAPGRLNF